MIEIQAISKPGYYTTPEFSGGGLNASWIGSGTRLLGLPEQFDPVMFDRLSTLR